MEFENEIGLNIEGKCIRASEPPFRISNPQHWLRLQNENVSTKMHLKYIC